MDSRLESIYNNYINGNRRDMVSQIDLYGQYQFWIDIKVYLTYSEWQVYISMHQSYCKIKGAI